MKSSLHIVSIIFLICSACFGKTYPTIYYVNLTNTQSQPYAKQYDLRQTAACVQGIANRSAPRVFLTFDYTGYHWPMPDSPWLTNLREAGGLCENWKLDMTLKSAYDLVNKFRTSINGVIVYDPAVYSTSLVATTAAGVEDAIAVRYDPTTGSVYDYLVNSSSGPKLPVLINLVGKFTGSGMIWNTSTPSTGSAKCDAYIWAKEKYIDTGKCDPTVLSYTLDQFSLTIPSTATPPTWPTPCLPTHWQLQNLDYAVSKRGFCFELSPWGDEKPNDDPLQPTGTDLNTYKAIMNACNLQTGKTKVIKCIGFINWPFKYTVYGNKGSHGEVETEWEMIKLQTAYNVYGEMDWSVANTSFFAGLVPAVLDRTYVQNPPPTYNDMVTRGLINSSGVVSPGNNILLCNTDYDQAGWTTYLLAGDRYNDSSKAYIYANWAVSPMLAERASAAMDYMYRHKTSQDYFMSSCSGAGYINPSKLYNSRSPSGYPSGVAIWQKHNKNYYRIFDYSITGWLLNGSAGSLTPTDISNYAPFSGRGVGVESNYTGGSPGLVANIPVLKRSGPDQAAASDLIANTSGTSFAWYRYILFYPYQIKQVQDDYAALHPTIATRFLDIPTFYYLMRYYMGGNNDYRQTWAGNSIPRVMEAGKIYTFNVTVRNDGWDTWSEANMYRLGHAVVSPEATPGYSDYGSDRNYLPAGVTVEPGQSFTFSVSLQAPTTNGKYDLYFDMVRDGTTWFFDQGNNSLRKKIIVATNETDIDTDSDGLPDVIEDRAGTLYWNPYDQVACGDLGYNIADINGPSGTPDCYVDMYDVAALATDWLATGAADISGATGLPDGQIDFYDFTVIAAQWLQCTDPHNSDCW